MATDLQRLSAALAERMRELGCAPTDPRVAPLLAQVQALMREHLANVQAGANVAMLSPGSPRSAPAASTDHSNSAVSYDLPADLVRLLKAYLAICPSNGFTQAPALSQSEEGRRILELGPAERAKMAVQAYAALTSVRYGGPDGSGLRRVVSDLLRAKLALEEAQAIALVKAAVRDGFLYTSYSPNQIVLSTLERHVQSQGLSPDLRGAIEGLLARMKHGYAEGNAQGRKLLNGVEALLAHQAGDGASIPEFKPRPDAWGRAVSAKLSAMPAGERARLTPLLALAAKGGDGAKPAKGWLKSAAQAVDQPDRAGLAELLLAAIACEEEDFQIAPDNQDTVRGLVWLAALAAPEVAAQRLEAFAQTCLTFSPAHFTYRSLMLGNAAIHAFSLLPGLLGVGSLMRLRRRLKRPGEIKTVDKALAALAEARGVTPGELEEIGLPDYGFGSDGALAITVGPATAVLTITEADALDVAWHDAGGQPLKGPPAELKANHADALKAFKAQLKEIGDTLKAQRLRLERLYLDEREWTLADWQARYRDAPLVECMVQRLIWSFRLRERWVAGLPEGDAVRDASGTNLDLGGRDVRVRLWHPMQSEAGHVLAWRQRLASLEVTQPFKQAHRENYVLTDAERQAESYSNRFAGHIVQQKQFRALCQARGWSCPAYGSWDPGDGRPVKRLRELQVEFWVEPIEGEIDAQDFQFRYLSTDQVRFANGEGEPIALERVPPVLFSELMRDVDLFVGVASIGNDPTWGDRGDGAYGDYWNRAAFGALSEAAKTRRAVLEDLLPGLKIARQSRLEDRFLVVEGKLRTYRIHLGSANVQMEPNNQYLCIVRGGPSGGHVRLPFDGDEMLSLVLSKAFLLAEDDKIKDSSILSQIRRG
ncbi:MAG TPA: DUF4132 domain-containing protein [Candidatus Acidoferrum sp.]|nr:DUF4132 domain-containing protein [Candidatus Acidoferrum sp.]